MTIVIPTYRRTDKLRRALDRLDGQLGGPSFEVIVVDNPGGDGEAAIEAAIGERSYETRVLVAPIAGASAARNTGWRAARSPLILFIGDDILATPRLVAEHLDWHERNPGDEVGVLGRVEWAGEVRRTPFMRWLERGMQFDYGAIQGDEAGWGRLYTANVSLKRALLERVGGFDEEGFPYLYEDIDLGYRLDKIGFRLLYNRRAVGEHLHQTTVNQWRLRMAAAAQAEHRFVDEHPDFEPYFLRRFEAAAQGLPPRGRGTRLAAFVPRWVPWLGPKVWEAAGRSWMWTAAPDFIATWELADEARDQAGSADPAAAKPSGSPPSGPK